MTGIAIVIALALIVLVPSPTDGSGSTAAQASDAVAAAPGQVPAGTSPAHPQPRALAVAPAPAEPAAAPNPPTPALAPRAGGKTTLSIPAAGVRGIKIIRYKGVPDDGKGTAIQDRGLVAAPYGGWGGVLPGQVGNYLLTGHRTVDGAPMARVPNLRAGDLVTVRAGASSFTYKIAYLMTVSFRDPVSKKSQRLPVPGRPGVAATQPAITLSTCSTPEDNAAGLPWRDRYGNPTHRIVAVGFIAG